ncbi:hypothetical protein [Comamonas thiooxydans]|uniref:hypothetical protein n=1 Tax=Comamonas thiooxydans TaxID=363952 RepID=UPI0010394097|nr:hypothetical protein [Comamonas thiooxydans]
MSWDRSALWSKAVLFMQRATAQDKDSPEFGLWASLGLELLARAAVAKTSPALLADPDKDQKNLLHALGISLNNAPKSIPAIQVLSHCRTLVSAFTEDEFKAASALLNRRNEELHTGSAAFATFPLQSWIGGFFRCCKILAEHQGETLISLFGEAEAREAEEILGKAEASVISQVKASISAHSKVFEAKEISEKAQLMSDAETESEKLSHRGHHRVVCPSCKSSATVQGTTYGGERLEHKDGLIIVRESVTPTKFCCLACGLKLSGYPELVAAGVGDHFTHRSEYSPPDYYELVDPNDRETMDRYAEDHGYYHFSND